MVQSTMCAVRMHCLLNGINCLLVTQRAWGCPSGDGTHLSVLLFSDVSDDWHRLAKGLARAQNSLYIKIN